MNPFSGSIIGVTQEAGRHLDEILLSGMNAPVRGPCQYTAPEAGNLKQEEHSDLAPVTPGNTRQQLYGCLVIIKDFMRNILPWSLKTIPAQDRTKCGLIL